MITTVDVMPKKMVLPMIDGRTSPEHSEKKH